MSKSDFIKNTDRPSCSARLPGLALIRMGRKEEAVPFLEKLKETLSKASYVDLLKYEESMMECEDGFLEEPKYLELLEKLICAIRAERHFGHLYFYRDVIVEAYKRQRKYKQALEFERDTVGTGHDMRHPARCYSACFYRTIY